MTTRSLRVLAFVDHLVDLVDSLGCYPRHRRFFEWVALMLFSKALVVGRATCALTRAGFAEEAFGFTRTLVDIFFTIRYISNKNRETRARRFYKFFTKERQSWMRTIPKYFSDDLSGIRQSRRHKEMMRVARTYRHPHEWTGKGGQAKLMAMEGSTREKGPDGNPARAEFDYEIIYKWTSRYVHPTITSLESHLIEVGVPFAVHKAKRPAIDYEDLALFNVVLYLRRIADLALDAIGVELPPRTVQRFDQVVASLRHSRHR